MIADIKTNKKFLFMVEEIFLRCIKLNMSLAFITKSCSKRSQIKFYNKRELPNFVINYLTDIGYKDFMNTYSYCTS